MQSSNFTPPARINATIVKRGGTAYPPLEKLVSAAPAKPRNFMRAVPSGH